MKKKLCMLSLALGSSLLKMENMVQVSPTLSNSLEPKSNWLQTWLPWLRWTPTSANELKDAEEALLEHANVKSEGFYVDVGKVNGENCRIWTRKFGKNDAEKVPLVMVHGMGAGLAMFVLNLESLSNQRLVYAIDLPGFGRSSRVSFSSDPSDIESEYVECIENWRQNVGLKKMNLLGHSFGGHLTALYSFKYPQNLNTAILADPWGMTSRNVNADQRRTVPTWVRALAKVLSNFNPLWGLRAAGPAGPWLVSRARPDIMRKYDDLLGEGSKLVSDYIFHCNGHNPTGESAFHSLMAGFGWASNPIMPRIHSLDKSVKMKVLYGSKSWMTHLTKEDFTDQNCEANVDVEYIQEAGHHIYADQYKQFNYVLNKFLKSED